MNIEKCMKTKQKHFCNYKFQICLFPRNVLGWFAQYMVAVGKFSSISSEDIAAIVSWLNLFIKTPKAITQLIKHFQKTNGLFQKHSILKKHKNKNFLLGKNLTKISSIMIYRIGNVLFSNGPLCWETASLSSQLQYWIWFVWVKRTNYFFISQCFWLDQSFKQKQNKSSRVEIFPNKFLLLGIVSANNVGVFFYTEIDDWRFSFAGFDIEFGSKGFLWNS